MCCIQKCTLSYPRNSSVDVQDVPDQYSLYILLNTIVVRLGHRVVDYGDCWKLNFIVIYVGFLLIKEESNLLTNSKNNQRNHYNLLILKYTLSESLTYIAKSLPR